jgi:hypothetical protein
VVDGDHIVVPIGARRPDGELEVHLRRHSRCYSGHKRHDALIVAAIRRRITGRITACPAGGGSRRLITRQ